MCLDAAVPCSPLSAMADEASGEDRTFADVTDDQLMVPLDHPVRPELPQRSHPISQLTTRTT